MFWAGATSTAMSTPSGATARISLPRVGLAVVHDVVRTGRAGERRLLSLLTVVTTVAPAQRASWIAALPTAPAPPATSTVVPSSAPGTEPGRAALGGGQRAVRGDGRHADARAQVVGRALGQRHDPVGGLDGVLGGGAVGAAVLREHQPDPVAHGQPVDAGADRVDHARRRPGRA